nr:hypothetical protein [Tanacetum cinerariifolium]
MIVAQQADDVADEGAAGVDVDAVPTAVEPFIPLPTPTTQPPPPSQELPSTSQVIPTPPPLQIAKPSLPPQQQQPSQHLHDAKISLDLLHTLLETCTTLTKKVEALEQDKVDQALEIIKLKQRVKKLERKNKLKVPRLRRLRKRKINDNIDADEDVTLKDVAAIEKIAKIKENTDDDELEPPELKEVVTTAKQMTELVTAATATITAATYLITATTITAAPSAARRRKGKLDEEVEELKKHLQIIPNNDDDDVYTEATPLALKNFSDDFLLTTRTYMFEKPAVKAQVWKSQRGVYGLGKVKSWRLLESCGVHIITLTTTQMILLVERRYPLTRFTLDQMLNNVRLEVEEESEVSLELLRFIRQQQQEGFRQE